MTAYYALAAGRQARAWRRDSGAAATTFATAAGEVAFSTDGTMIHTRGGWREMRLGIFAKRPRGPAAAPEQWDERDLPALSARVRFGGVWTAEQFGPQWRAWASRLGLRETAAITALADGAKWIWSQAARSLPGAAGVLDIYHAGEHLYAAAKGGYGEGAAEAPAWVDARRQTLLRGGATALEGDLTRQEAGLPASAARPALAERRAYLTPHAAHTGYAGRLRQGRAMGSGMVEGACKAVVGKRLKQTGARWRVRHAEPMVALGGLLYGDLWEAYWATSPN